MSSPACCQELLVCSVVEHILLREGCGGEPLSIKTDSGAI